MGGAIKYFLKKLLGHERFRAVVSWATKTFLKNLQNPPAPHPTYLMYAPLEWILPLVSLFDTFESNRPIIFNHRQTIKQEWEKHFIKD